MKNDTIFQDKLDDLKLQMAMQLLGQKELEESEKEIENLNSLPEAQPTLYEQQLVIKTIDRALRQQRLKHTFSTASRIIQKVSVFLVILLIGIFTTIITVDAIRVPFIKWIVKLHDDSTTIIFNQEDNTPDVTFHYLPEGYAATFVSARSETTYYVIENTEENVILLIIYSLDAGMSVDTEDAVVSEHLINGNKAMGVVKGNDSTLIWSTDQYSVTLTGVIPLEELTHIAEGMIF